MEVYLRLNPDGIEVDADQTITEADADLYKDNSITFHSNTGIGALHSQGKETFKFDKIFAPTTSQNEISSYLVPSIVRDLYSGINSSIITFGSKHTGKTYTLYGQQGLYTGVVPRLFTKLFQHKDTCDKNHAVSFKIAALNVLNNDTINDIFNIGHTLSLQKDNVHGGYWAKNANWLYCHTLQELMSLLIQISNVTQGHTILKLEMIQTYISSNTIIKSTLTIVDLENNEPADNKLYDKFITMIRDVTKRTDLKSTLNKLIWDSIFDNYNTRLILTCSLLPVCQGDTLKILELSKYLSKIVKYDIIRNRSWISPADKYEVLSQQTQLKSDNYQKQIDLLNDTISLLESKAHDFKKKQIETESLITDNLSLEAQWQNLINNETNDETLEIMLDKNSTLNNQQFQLSDQIEANKFVHRERNNGQRVESDFDVMNSKLLEFINKQETKVQDILNENMACKEHLDQLQKEYSINKEKIRLLENEIAPFVRKELSQHSISSYGTVASSVITEESLPSSSRNSGLFQSSTASPSSSSVTQRSPNRIRSREHSLSGFNLQILKSK